MKKPGILLLLAFVALVILLPSSGTGKFDVSNSVVADGNPLPWPFPNNSVLSADGNPLPWPFPNSSVLSADGNPLPWPFPSSSALAA